MTPPASVIHSDPDILGGAPVFFRTRAPLKALIDFLGGGRPLGEYVEAFPSISRDQAITALRIAAHTLVVAACPV